VNGTGEVLVTGGTGVVGAAVLRELLASGRTIRALVRSPASSDRVAAIGARPVRGDVMDRATLQKAADGVDSIFHAAGMNAFCLPDPSQLFRVNVHGSVNVIRAAADAGVSRVVYTSSAATIGERKGAVGDEDASHRGSFLSEYERSKYEAEVEVSREATRLGVHMVSVNPSSVQGPGRAGGTGKVLVAYLRGKLRFFVDTRVSLVDIDDCARGHRLAEQRGVAGRRYLLNGTSLTTEELLALVGRITGLRSSPRILPASIATTGAGVIETLYRLRGRRAPVCREMVRTMLHGHHYDGSRAERELGLSYTPVAETIHRTIEWMVREGLAPRPPRLEVV
jgi:dihydroflavonol-4-reductase